LADPSVPRASGIARFGSFALQLEAEDTLWAAVLLRRCRAVLQADPAISIDLRLRVRIEPGTRPSRGPSEPHVRRLGAQTQISAAPLLVDLDRTVHPATAQLAIDPGTLSAAELEHIFSSVVHKLLQLCGVVRLHAAAIEFDGHTHVFVGDKGAGKSTLSLALGQAGGCVLAEDQIVVRRQPDGLWVSGCDGNIRLTAESERHFLQTPLDVTPGDYAGVPKKEVPLASLVPSRPYEDRRATRLYFARVGHGLTLRPVSGGTAVARLLDAIAPAHGFADPADRLDLLRLVAEFVEPLTCADLELSPRLDEIGQLARLLQS
jgi:hypothetical protein